MSGDITIKPKTPSSEPTSPKSKVTMDPKNVKNRNKIEDAAEKVASTQAISTPKLEDAAPLPPVSKGVAAKSVPSPHPRKGAFDHIKSAILEENHGKFLNLIPQDSPDKAAIKGILVDLLKEDPSEKIDEKLFDHLIYVYKNGKDQEKDFALSVFQTVLALASAKNEFENAAIKFGREMLKTSSPSDFYISFIEAKAKATDVKKFDTFVFDTIFKDQDKVPEVENLHALLSGNYEKLADNWFPKELLFNKKIVKSEEDLLRFIKKLIQNNDKIGEVILYVRDYENQKRVPSNKKLLDELTILTGKDAKRSHIDNVKLLYIIVEISEDYTLRSKIIEAFKNEKGSKSLGILDLKGLNATGNPLFGLISNQDGLIHFVEKSSVKSKKIEKALLKLQFAPGGILWEYEREVDETNPDRVIKIGRGRGDGSITRLRKKIMKLRDEDPVGNKAEIEKLLKKQRKLREKMTQELNTVFKDLQTVPDINEDILKGVRYKAPEEDLSR